MVRTKHPATYKGTNPKLEKVKTILKYAKALEKLIIMFQTEELLNQDNNNDNNIINQLSPIINNSSPKRRGRPKKANNVNNVNNKEVKEDEEENKLINKFDENVKIDYTGVSELMSENKDCDIELK